MVKKSFNLISKSALVAVIATSPVLPVMLVDAEVVKKIDAFYLNWNGTLYEISLDLYNKAIGLGLNLNGDVSHFCASNGEIYTVEMYNRAIALTNTSHEAIELLENGGHAVKGLNAGKVIAENGALKYIPPEIAENFLIIEVLSINKTGVTVTFPSLEKNMENQTITVIDPDGTETPVRALNLLKEATEATFEFEIPLIDLTAGTWIVNGIEFIVEDNLEVNQELQAAINAVEKAETSKIQADVNAAKVLVDQLPNTTEVEVANKQELLDRLATVQSDIDALIAAEQAVLAAENASDEVQALVDAAKALVEKLPQDTENEKNKKEELENRLNTIQEKIDSDLVSAAREAVDAAQTAVNTVKAMLENGTDGQDLLNAVEEAEQKLNEAQKLVSALSNNEEKSVLQGKLDDILFSYVEEYVIFAEDKITQQSINKAQELVNRLPNEKKGEFPNRLAAVQKQVDTINEAIKLVDQLEKNPKRDEITDARLKVAEVSQIHGKASLAEMLDSRINNVEKKLLKTDLESLIDQAEAAVVATSNNNGNDILVGDNWVDEGTQATFENAIASANNVLSNENVTLEQYKVANAELSAAIANYNGKKGKGSYTLLNAAITAVEKAEKIDDKTANVEAIALYDTAKKLVEQLENEPEKPGLENRLVAVDTIILATAAVENAEATLTLTNIKAAEDLVKLIQDKNKVIRTALENRLEKLKAGEKDANDLNDAIAAAEPHVDKQNKEKNFYTGESFSKFKLAYDAAILLKEKLEQSPEEVTLEEITLKTESLIEATANLIEAQGPVLKNENENPNPARKKTVELNLRPDITNIPDKEVTSGGVLGLGLGIVDLGLLSASQLNKVAATNKHSVTVEKGTTYNANVTVAIHTILGGQAFDIGIYKKDMTDGNYKQIKVLSGSSGGLLGIANTVNFTLDTLEEGEYVFILDLGGGLAVVQVAPFKLTNQIVLNYNKTAEGVSVTGDLLSDWDLGGRNEGIVSHIKVGATNSKPQQLEQSEETVIQGRYGQLFINQNGTYKYLPANVPTNIGKVETFEYEVTNTHNGVSATADLQIRISAETVEWNEGNWGQDVTVVKAQPKEQSTKIEVSNATNTVTSPDARTQWALWYDGTLQSGDIKVQDKSSVLTFGVSKNLPAQKTATVRVINSSDGSVVYNETMDISTTAQSIVVRDLDAGAYKITVKGTGSMGGSTGWLKNIKVNSSTWGQYIVDEPTPLTGNLRKIEGNKLGESDSLKTDLSIWGYLVDGDNISTVQTYHKLNNGPKVIAGKYGVLTVQLDGSYSYKPNANIKVAGQTDVFTYKLTHASGIESESTLTFKINPLITFSDQDDILAGTAEIDTFKGGQGSDTLVYNTLNEDATGGNNHDVWSDFHYGTIATDRNADRIDLRLLFENQHINDVSQYLQLTKNGQSFIFKVDRDGAGSSYGFTDLVTLNISNGTGEEISLKSLIDNGQLIIQ